MREGFSLSGARQTPWRFFQSLVSRRLTIELEDFIRGFTALQKIEHLPYPGFTQG
jgi:hypothetical protein